MISATSRGGRLIYFSPMGLSFMDREIVYRRAVPRLGHNQAIGIIAHRQCRLIWLILHQRVRYEERGPAVSKRSKQLRTWKMIRDLRRLGYRIESPNLQPSQAQAQ
jgi:hypothetical protein